MHSNDQHNFFTQYKVKNIPTQYVALLWYKKALKIRENVLGKEHTDTATIYSDIARVYDSMGEYDVAIVWYEKTLKIGKKQHSKE